MEPGHRLVYYAAVHRKVFAIVEATSDPYAFDHPRWPWRVDVEPLVAVPLLANAPPVEAIGVMPRSLSQHSHITIEQRHYDLAVEAIGSVAAVGSPP